MSVTGTSSPRWKPNRNYIRHLALSLEPHLSSWAFYKVTSQQSLTTLTMFVGPLAMLLGNIRPSKGMHQCLVDSCAKYRAWLRQIPMAASSFSIVIYESVAVVIEWQRLGLMLRLSATHGCNHSYSQQYHSAISQFQWFKTSIQWHFSICDLIVIAGGCFDVAYSAGLSHCW